MQESLDLRAIHLLREEFPGYELISAVDDPKILESKEVCRDVEIFYGRALTAASFHLMHQLRWIHVPTCSLEDLCLTAIQQRGNILISNTKEEHSRQVGEFVIGTILAFSKNILTDAPPWCLKNRILLQVGLGHIGTEIARLAQLMGMRVYGIRARKTFHPYCNKVLSIKDLHSVLPAADILSICPPGGRLFQRWKEEAKLELLTPDSILIAIGSGHLLDHIELERVAPSLRGVAIDGPLHTLPKALKDAPNVLLTENKAALPALEEPQGFRLFNYNLRHYVRGNTFDMKNQVDPLQDPSLYAL